MYCLSIPCCHYTNIINVRHSKSETSCIFILTYNFVISCVLLNEKSLHLDCKHKKLNPQKANTVVL